MYTVQHLVLGKARDAHGVHMRFYADKELKMMRRVTEVFQRLEHHAKYNIEWIGEVKKAATDDGYAVRVYS